MIIIIGAGLSGLLTAYRLKQQSIPFKILEARDRIGGRINTVNGSDNTPVEMGATWFNNGHRHLIALLNELKINAFEQKMDNPVFYQPSSTVPIQSVQIPAQGESFRISGGTAHLINTLRNVLDDDEVLLNQMVTSIKFLDNFVQVDAKESFECDSVVLAIPPKLWANKISFEPQLSIELSTVAKQTHTWMEDSIKVALTYAQPFWEQENISSTFFSNTGPIIEFYDHCNHARSTFALCGFMHPSFKELSLSERRAQVIDQIKKVFGPSAANFVHYEDCIWSNETHTFDASDTFLNPHQNNGHPIFSQRFFNDKLLISSAESAAETPGYMDGAVCAGNVIAERIIGKG